MVLQAPLLEFCYQTSHPPLLGRGAGPLPVNKVTVLARTLQSRLLPSSNNRLQVERQGEEGIGSHEPPDPSHHHLAPRASGEGKGKFASWARSCTRQCWCN